MSTEVRLVVLGNLGALLMASSNMHGALEILDQAVGIVRDTGMDAASVRIPVLVTCFV